MTPSRLLVPLVLAAALQACRTAPEPLQPVDIEKPVNTEVLETLINTPRLALPNQSTYILGPGDVVSFQLLGRGDILNETNGGGDVVINDNPNVVLPLIPPVRVHGKTAAEVEAEMKKAYGEIIVDPRPQVIVKKFQNFQLDVLGHVRRPGKFPLEPGDTVLEAIFKAGGLSPSSSRFLKIYREKLNREEKTSLSHDEIIGAISSGGKMIPREEITIPIDDFQRTGVLKYAIPMLPNDIVFVPPSGGVIVHGRVVNPGAANLGVAIQNVTHILTERGGLRYGASSKITVQRTDEKGEKHNYTMNARRMLKRKDPDFVLKEGDEIWVDTHPFRAVLEFLGSMVARGTAAGVNATVPVYNQGGAGGAP